jgi:hypothetical protein
MIMRRFFYVGPCFTPGNRANRPSTDAHHGGNLSMKILARITEMADMYNLSSSKFSRAVFDAPAMPAYVFAFGDVYQILHSVVSGILVSVVDIVTRWSRPQKGLGYQLMTWKRLPFSIAIQTHRPSDASVQALLPYARRPPSFTTIVVADKTPHPTHTTKARNLVHAFVSNNWTPDFFRGRIGAHGEAPFAVSCPGSFQRRWGFVLQQNQNTRNGQGMQIQEAPK